MNVYRFGKCRVDPSSEEPVNGQAQTVGQSGVRRRWTITATVAVALTAGFALSRFLGAPGSNRDGPLKFVMHLKPQPVGSVAFITGDGKPMTLEDLRGRVVLLNVWATWCPPCKQEMPSLDRLQAKLGGTDFEVVALSIDKEPKGLAEVRSFYSQVGIRHLRIFQDPSGTAGFTLRAVGVPTTLLLDRRGQELGRLAGTAEWDSEEALTFMHRTISTGTR